MMLVCCNPLTREGCGRLNPDNAPYCIECGRSLGHAVQLPDPIIDGRYKILRGISCSAFGIVYQAKMIEQPGTLVAIKEVTSLGAVRAFRRDFNILKNHQHPNLVRYDEVFEANGSGYLVMEFVSGQNLQEVLENRGQPLPEPQVLEYAIQICDALSYLHQQNPPILHYHINPTNIRLQPDGLLKLVDVSLKQHIVTLLYPSLEQYYGYTDPRSDIYGLGATLYQLLTARVPPSPFERFMQPHEPLLPPHHYNPQITPAVAATIMKAMRMNPAERFADAESFKQALVGCQIPTPLDRSQRPFKLSCLVALGIIVFVLFSLFGRVSYGPMPVSLNPPLTLEDVPQSLPLATHAASLPHDGLFIRRNNTFGTRMEEGIEELISQGIMIDGTHIRFDDFVALNSALVPGPQAGRAVAVSYGIAPIPSHLQHERQATHFLEIALRTADTGPATLVYEQAPPVNYMFVVDISSSMEGEKLDSVKIAIRSLLESMHDSDTIGVITFNDTAQTLIPAERKQDLDIATFRKKINQMGAGGGTDINLGLGFGIAELEQHTRPDSVNQIFLFTDGNPTSGETEWLNIRRNVAADTRGKDMRLSTFAFGSDANTPELNRLAGVTGGEYTFVTEPAQLQFDLEEELNRRNYLAALNIQMQIHIDEAIPIRYLYGHDLVEDPLTRAAIFAEAEAAAAEAATELGVESPADIITAEEGIRIFVPDLAFGETYWVVFELDLSGGQQAVGDATVQFVDILARQAKRNELALLVSAGKLPSDVVVQHALGLWTSEVVFYALDDLYQQDLETAHQRIDQHIARLESSTDTLAPPQAAQIGDDIAVLRKFVLLAKNLGKPQGLSDAVAPDAGQTLYHTLNEFGRVRNGLNRVSASP